MGWQDSSDHQLAKVKEGTLFPIFFASLFDKETPVPLGLLLLPVHTNKQLGPETQGQTIGPRTGKYTGVRVRKGVGCGPAWKDKQKRKRAEGGKAHATNKRTSEPTAIGATTIRVTSS